MTYHKEIYQVDVPGQPTVCLEVRDLQDLKMALARVVALPRGRALAVRIWGERGGVIQGEGYRISHLGTMTFVPVEAPAATAAKLHLTPDVGTSVLKPRAVRPAPASEVPPFLGMADDLEITRLFDSLEGEA